MGCSEKLLDLVFPPRCVLCGGVCPGGELCCGRCAREEPPLAQPLRRGDGSAVRPWSVLACAFAYRGRVRSALSRFKFKGDMRAGEYLGGAMAKLVTGAFPPCAFDLVVPVPMPPERQRMRGYNQAEILARRVAEALDVPVEPAALLRQGAFAQHQLTAGFRRREAAHSFRPGDVELRGTRVLLVDDILASGQAILGLLEIASKAGAEIAGIGVAIEKATKDGGDVLRRMGMRVESLVTVDHIEDGRIILAEDD